MGVIKGVISDDLEREFRRAVALKYGQRKGAISEAIAEAIKLWLNSIAHKSELKSVEVKEEKKNITLQKIDFKEMLKAFVGESPMVEAPHKTLGKIIVGYGVIYIPYGKVNFELTSSKAKAISEEHKCVFSMRVLDGENNYIAIYPKLGKGFGNLKDNKEGLKNWFMLEFPNLIEKIASKT